MLESVKDVDPASDWLDRLNNEVQFYRQAIAEYNKMDFNQLSWREPLATPTAEQPHKARKGHTTADHTRDVIRKLFMSERQFNRRVTVVQSPYELPYQWQTPEWMGTAAFVPYH